VIKIDFQEPDDPKWKKWRADCNTATKKLISAYKPGKKSTISKLYAHNSIKHFFFSKEGSFAGKCAYCEAYILERKDLDHFRPKNGVTDEHDHPIMITVDDAEMPHPGYYWLAYDWRNLLPACNGCNQATTIEGRKVGKHTRFPVRGSHVHKPDDLEAEEPMLINPVEEDPSPHFTFDEEGVIAGLTDRGEMCVQVFGLNLRGRLIEERKMAIDQMKFTLIKIYVEPRNREKLMAQLNDVITGRTAYSAACREALKQMKPYVAKIWADI
jgi:hypothetical protein